MSRKLSSASICLLLAACLASTTYAVTQRSPWSMGGTGTTPLPPNSSAPLANQPNYNPTVPYIGIIPTFITSTVSERFLLVLRLENGQVVGVTRAETRQVVLLRAPAGETLRLDVFPLDGAGQPIVGIPVQVGVSVAVSVGAP